MREYQRSIGEDRAIALAESRWWASCTPRQITQFQLFTCELCLPFDVFHEALEKSLGRPVFTHELGLNFDGIVREFLGQDEPTTMQEIIDLIPEEKRIIIKVAER
jgi:hypothetical protein